MLLLIASISIQAQIVTAGETLRSWSDLQVTTADLNPVAAPAISWSIENYYQPDTVVWVPAFKDAPDISFGVTTPFILRLDDQKLPDDDDSQIGFAKNITYDNNVVFADFGSLRFSISIYSGTVFIYTPSGTEIYMKGGMAKQIKEYHNGKLNISTSYEDDKYKIVIDHATGAVTWEPLTVKRE